MSHERPDHGDERAAPGDDGDRDDGGGQASDDELPAPPHTVHDAFFKKMFSDPENALGELRAVLPARVAAHLDLDTLELQHASVVEDWLRQRHGDLVYTARTKEAEPVLLWFLLEHQSSVEPFMAWEILQKAVAMMKDWRSKHPDATRLPAVLSFVLYNGDGPWTAPTSIQELIELSESARADFGDYLLSYRYVLDDLQATPTEALDARDLEPLTRLVLLAMKLASSERMLEELRRHHLDIVRVLRGPQGKDRLETVLYYLWSTNDELTPGRLIEQLEPIVGQEIADPMQTVAQQIEQRGFDKGRVKGRDEGRDEGRSEGRRSLLL
ncbi:Rpn family recombination-promoting nuclease/putative transposase, partial [Haliangium sp.]|uniref:Rpn family recombination-promoting nuclease/putative transposase n=1 Tax=Haliangium sp. TaxID=2663208 RepID=UPI003D14C4BC